MSLIQLFKSLDEFVVKQTNKNLDLDLEHVLVP